MTDEHAREDRPAAVAEREPDHEPKHEHEHEEQPRGTLLLMLLFLVATIGMWFYIYNMLLSRA